MSLQCTGSPERSHLHSLHRLPVARKASAPVLLAWRSVRVHLLIRAPKQPLEPFLEVRLMIPGRYQAMVFECKDGEVGIDTDGWESLTANHPDTW